MGFIRRRNKSGEEGGSVAESGTGGALVDPAAGPEAVETAFQFTDEAWNVVEPKVLRAVRVETTYASTFEPRREITYTSESGEEITEVVAL